MQWSDIDFDPPRKTLRQFAGIWLAVVGSLAAWHGLARGRLGLGGILAALAVTVGAGGLIRPALVRGVYVAANVVTFPIGWVVSRLILALVYYGIVTPMAVFFRLRGRDALQRRRRLSQATYWSEKRLPSEVSRYFRQF